ncbi:carboxylesterase domain protein [Mycobacterium kansasii]|uniref:Carboxylesterase domain protein n=1 Tax=Mycobacterium kansasii TaxID=1768 RepID=A0A1V3WFB9_MYCKA|nr:carboxylesterase domain protein [Mycobacterium kansasii]
MFWFGWPASEVPGMYLSVSVLDAVRRGRRGDFAGPKGKTALALTVAAWAILGVIRYRGITTPGPVLEAGLSEGSDPTTPANSPRCRPSRRAGAGVTCHCVPPWRAGVMSRRPTSWRTARIGAPTWPTSGAAATCPVTARRRCWCRCPAARG